MGRPALSNFLNGKAALSPAMAVRLERTFGADRDALLDLQTRFDAREAPSGRRTITAATYAPSVLAVKAREIGDWAGRIESRQELGALVRRLVNSTGRDLSKVDFPAHDDAERRGWDGMVVASAPTPVDSGGRVRLGAQLQRASAGQGEWRSRAPYEVGSATRAEGVHVCLRDAA